MSTEPAAGTDDAARHPAPAGASAPPAAAGDDGPDGLAVHRVPATGMTERVVRLVADRLERGADPGGVAVLARVNSALLPVQIGLGEAGLPATAPLDPGVLRRTGIRTALAYLRIGLAPGAIRREDVLDTLNRPARKVKSAVEPLLRRRARWSLADLAGLEDALGPPHDERFSGYLGELHDLVGALREGADTAHLLWLVRSRIGLGEAMDALDASRTRPEGSSHGDDLDALEQLAALQPDPAAFGPWLADRLRAPADPAGVTLSTVHRVKGMEWDHVVVFAANAGLFPHRLSEEVEEERRVLHVAITRCREHVDLVADRQRPSPFLDELHRPAPARARPDGGPAAPPAAVAPTWRADGVAIAEPGVELTLPGGFAGRVRTVRAGVARVALRAGAEVDVALGESVEIEGRRTSLGAPPRGTAVAEPAQPHGSAADTALVEALKAWRSRTAVDAGVPAYLVFHDRHLEAIAGRRPRTVGELADCPGVGPAKLDRYADDLLDLVEQHAP